MRSCQSYLRGIDLAVGNDRRAQGSGRVVETGLHRADRCADDLGDLGQRKARVVVQDEDRAMLRRKAPEGAVEGVPIIDRQDWIGPARFVDR